MGHKIRSLGQAIIFFSFFFLWKAIASETEKEGEMCEGLLTASFPFSH